MLRLLAVKELGEDLECMLGIANTTPLIDQFLCKRAPTNLERGENSANQASNN